MKKIFLMILIIGMGPLAMAQKEKAKRIDFDGLDVDGEVRTPDGQYILQKSGVDFLPIYEVKTEMQNEIKKSIYFLR
jgi:hypothetical protein